MRPGNHVLDDPVPSLGIMVRDPVGKRVMRKAPRLAPEVAFFFMKETLAIRDKILQVADLGLVDGRIIGLVTTRSNVNQAQLVAE
jgi:hypothetical protein